MFTIYNFFLTYTSVIVDFFLENLNGNDFYEYSVNMKCFLLKNRGNIISDYFKIANKKNKLGKLFQLNGMCCYMKLKWIQMNTDEYNCVTIL